MLGFSTIADAPIGARLQAVDEGLPPPVGNIDVSKIPKSRTVVFDGGVRTVIFAGGTRTVTFAGGTRTVRF